MPGMTREAAWLGASRHNRDATPPRHAERLMAL
jgi:hypothetical protein